MTLGGVEAVGELALGQPREQASLLEYVPERLGTSCRPGYSMLTSYSDMGVNLVDYVMVIDDFGWLKASPSRCPSISSQRLLPAPLARWKECLAIGLLELWGDLVSAN